MEDNITKIQEIFHELCVREVMTRDVITVTPQTSMKRVQEILRAHRISGTPVLENDDLVGIVSIMDLIQTLEAGQIEQPASEHMTPKPQMLYADERVISAIRKLQTTGYGRFPVVDRGTGKLIGILTHSDIIRGTLKQLDIHYRRRESTHYRTQHFFEDVVSENTSIVLNYSVQARDFVHGGRASSQFKRSLQNLGIHPKILRRVAVATYEAEMNLILHTTSGGKIRADVRAGRICIEVSDNGPGIPNVDEAMRPGFSTAPEWIREMGFGAGMGLSNIQQCADEMTLTSTVGTGSQLRIVFQLNEEE